MSEKLTQHADALASHFADKLLKLTLDDGSGEPKAPKLGGILSVPVHIIRVGGGDVQVSLRKETGHAVITVQDDGGGVPAADLEHLFEPFYRASRPGAQPAGDGTGLGLAIAARAINRHGGAIEARNVNDGLLVTMTLG